MFLFKEHSNGKKISLVFTVSKFLKSDQQLFIEEKLVVEKNSISLHLFEESFLLCLFTSYFYLCSVLQTHSDLHETTLKPENCCSGLSKTIFVYVKSSEIMIERFLFSFSYCFLSNPAFKLTKYLFEKTQLCNSYSSSTQFVLLRIFFIYFQFFFSCSQYEKTFFCATIIIFRNLKNESTNL